MHKKSQLEDWIPFVVSMVALVFIFLFFLGFRIHREAVAADKLNAEIENIDSNKILINYLKTPVEVEGTNKQTTIAEIISMVGIEEGKEQRIKVFQEKTKEVFEQQFPALPPEIQGSYPWWIKIYDADEEPKQFGGGEKYFSVSPLPGKGYAYIGGTQCDPESTSQKNVVNTVIVPKIDRGYVKLVFCLYIK